MANKENLSPHTARQLQDNKSTPPTIASGSRVWQPSSSNSPSPGLLTPSSKPALRQQRDHSACRIQNSPLKVRKTRENLKQASLYADIPPPCVHGFHANGSDCHVQPGDSAAAYPRPDPRFARAQDEFSDASGSTLVGEASQVQVPRPLTPMGPSQTGKLLRHRSISRRVLTRVKEGISQRSRSSHTKTQDPDAILVRRFSGKRKESLEEQSRSRSFEVSRDSIDVQGYVRTPEVEMSTPGRSFTDSSVATDDSNRSGFLHTPPQVRCAPPAHTRQYSGRLLTPEPGTCSPSAEPTPRASARDISSSLGREGTVLVTVPFVDLTISPDRESVDVGRSHDIWVAVEGTVRTRVVESNSMQPQEAQLRKSSMDAIIIIDQEVLQTAPKSTHKIIVELCSRLNVAGDRLAVLCAKVEHVGTRTTKCDCDELHALRTPSLSRLFERLSIAPSTVDTIFEEEWESLADSLQALSTRGLRKDLVQTFVISKTPTAILQLVDRQVPWPVHTFKIGLSSERTEFPSATIKLHNWAVEIHDDQEDIVDLLDNMIRDLRHGCSIGGVPSLRLCYKPLQGTSIIEVLGQKALKNVQLGQRCIMFLKVRIPRIDTSRASLPKDDIDQDSLFAELESIVGTLKTEYLHVEARYRNSVLPSDNVVNVRHICSIRRPKMDSRWSVTDSDKESSATDRVLGRLAYFLAANYPPTRALRMIDRWAVRTSASPSDVVQNIQRFLEFQASGASDLGDTTTGSQNDRPAVIITSTEIDAGENFSTAPNTPVGEATPRGASSLSIRPHDTESDPPTLQTSFLSTASAMPPTRTISAPRTTTAVTISSSGGATVSSTDGEDTARQVWRQMRRSSLSAKQLAEMTSENLQILEAGDGMLKAVRQQALMNKRSIGAETLRDLKWESLRGSGHGEAPWL